MEEGHTANDTTESCATKDLISLLAFASLPRRAAVTPLPTRPPPPTMLDVSSPPRAVEVLHRLSLSHFADCMSGNDLMPLQTVLRLTIMPLLAYFDPALHAVLWNCGFGDGGGEDDAAACSYSFCLPWILTWFSHDRIVMEQDAGASVKRLMDAFVSAHPLFPVYVTVALMLEECPQRLELDCGEMDFCYVHQVLTALPRYATNWDTVIERAVSLMRLVPPRKIVSLAESYYGEKQVQEWLSHSNSTPQILRNIHVLDNGDGERCLFLKRNSAARIAAGYGEGHATMRRRRQRRQFSALALLVVVIVVATTYRFMFLRLTGAQALSVKDVERPDVATAEEEHSPSTASVELNAIFERSQHLTLSTSHVTVSDASEEELDPATPLTNTKLTPKALLTTLLALYLHTFLLVASGPVQALETHLRFEQKGIPY